MTSDSEVLMVLQSFFNHGGRFPEPCHMWRCSLCAAQPTFDDLEPFRAHVRARHPEAIVAGDRIAAVREVLLHLDGTRLSVMLYGWTSASGLPIATSCELRPRGSEPSFSVHVEFPKERG